MGDRTDIHLNRVNHAGRKPNLMQKWPKARKKIKTFKTRLYLDPHPQGRPRASSRGKFIIMYPTEKDKSYRNEVTTMLLNNRVGMSERLPFTGKIIANLEFYCKPPKSPKKIPDTKIPKGDVDNYIKALFDCCNKVLFDDDRQVVKLHAGKQYATDKEPPGIKIELYEIGGEK